MLKNFAKRSRIYLLSRGILPIKGTFNSWFYVQLDFSDDYIDKLKVKTSVGIRAGTITSTIKENAHLVSVCWCFAELRIVIQAGALLYDLPINELPTDLTKLKFGSNLIIDAKTESTNQVRRHLMKRDDVMKNVGKADIN